MKISDNLQSSLSNVFCSTGLEPENKKTEVKKTETKNAKKYFREYCGNTSIHGFRYFSEHRTILESIWWGVSIAISLTLCVTLVWKTYDKWQNSPVIVSFATKETPVWQVPFPAITICPETKSLPSKYNYSHYLNLKRNNVPLDHDSEKKFGYLSSVCNYKNDIDFAKGEYFVEDDFYEFLHEVQPDFLGSMRKCHFMGNQYNCSEIFTPLIVDEGICYTFNLIDRSLIFRENVVPFKNYAKAPIISNWTLEYGYPSSDEIDTYPRRTLFSGAMFALEGILSIDEDALDYDCRDSIQGYKMQISHPSSIPRTQLQHLTLPLDQFLSAAVALDMMTTSDAVRKYDPRRRNCYFPSERPLRYYKIYSQQNCFLECKTNYTLSKCGCIDFYMPMENGTKVCSQGLLDCVYEAERDMLYERVNNKLAMMRGEASQNIDVCDCLPECSSMKYVVETSQSQWNWRKLYPNEDKKKHMSYFQIYFKASQFITSERNELFGPTDFLANFGGLLGLFVGFSLLSLIEIIYYLSLRIIVNIKLFRVWSGKED